MIRNRLYNKQLKDSISAVIFNLLPVIQQNFLKKQQTVACLSNSHCMGACCRSSLALAAGKFTAKKGRANMLARVVIGGLKFNY